MPRSHRLAFFLLGGTSVASLLAWVYGLGSFRTWFLLVSVPGQLAMIVLAVLATRRHDRDELRVLLMAGVVGGLLGTLGYDLFRVPFAMAGLRVLAPIDSYGVLAAGATSSSAWTGLLGWSYHFSNGIGFGIAYAMLAPRRHWGWGIAWALVLETATVVSPFASQYALRTEDGFKLVPIAIAYAAHVPYGYALGRVVQRPDGWARDIRRLGGLAVPTMLALVVVGLALWLRPWSPSADAEAGRALDEGPSAVIVGQRFEPEWLRTRVGGCVTFDNRDDEAYEIAAPGVVASLPPGRSVVCFLEAGVHRVRTTDEPYAGGFVIVDPAA